MFEGGIVEETERIRAMGYSKGIKPMKAIGYRQANLLIDGEFTKRKRLSQPQRIPAVLRKGR